MNSGLKENDSRGLVQALSRVWSQLFSVIPHKDNLSNAVPQLDVEVNLDGSLNIQIVDNLSTMTFSPTDKFTVLFSSAIRGVNFYEDFHYSESNESAWGGSLTSYETGQARLLLLPSDAGGVNPVEVPIVCEEDNATNFSFHVLAFDAQGNPIDTNQTNWELHFDFNGTEGNQSKLASLSTSRGSSTQIYLHSKLRSGRVADTKKLLEAAQVIRKGLWSIWLDQAMDLKLP